MRVARGVDNRYLPPFTGTSFASPSKPDKSELYWSSMLTFFKPWTCWEELLHLIGDAQTSFREFHATTSPAIQSQIVSTQLARNSNDVAAAKCAWDEENRVNFGDKARVELTL